MAYNASQSMRHHTRAGSNRRCFVCVDFGGKNIRMSTAETDGINKPVFRLITKWPGRSGHCDFVPNLVVRSTETGKQSWGYEAENALSDDPAGYVAYYRLKRHLMEEGSDADDSKDSACLALISGLLNHAIGALRPASLLIIVAVPTHVKARGAHRYLEIWPQASPVDSESTMVWVADEAEMGGRGTESTTPLGANDEHDQALHTRVDIGSTTMVSTFSQRTGFWLTTVRMSVFHFQRTSFLQRICSLDSTT